MNNQRFLTGYMINNQGKKELTIVKIDSNGMIVFYPALRTRESVAVKKSVSVIQIKKPGG